MFTILGTIGCILFGLKPVPQVISAIRHRSCRELPMATILMEVVANIFCCMMVLENNIATGVWQYPLYFNYICAFILMGTLGILKLKYR